MMPLAWRRCGGAARWAVFAALTVAAGIVVAQERSQAISPDVIVDGLREPSAVAAVGLHRLAVTDTAAGTVAMFGRGGEVLWTVDAGLDHPQGLGASASGIWVADTGNTRVLLLAEADGAILETVALPVGARPTDVAAAGDGALWISASADDRLLRVSADRADILEVGGDAGSGLSAPRGLDADGEGGVYVTEALGGCVHHIDAQGNTVAVLGQLGVGEARFGKPKDVAVLADGDLAVLDTQIGTIQVITPDGQFVSMLADEEGPLQLDHPLGLARAGADLFVADAAAGAVYTVTPGHHDLRTGDLPHPSSLLRRERGALGNDDPSALCRQCHDGTRRTNPGNWDPMSRQHILDLEDPVDPSISVTDRGDLRCASCHRIHGGDEARQEIEVTDGRCETCHVAQVPSNATRGHALDRPIEDRWNAEVLLGRRSALPERTTCLMCHTPHGAASEPLLVVSNARLCAACHSGTGPRSHPMDAPADATVLAATADAGGLVGDDGRLTCLSCHDVHDSASGSLLRFRGGADGSCEACHDRAEHGDRWHPEESCSDCHELHGQAVLDSSDCGSCHEEQRARAAAGGHGDARCLDCHPATGDVYTGDDVAPDANPASRKCLACHHPTADTMQAPRVAHFDHPNREIIPPSGADPQLPLYTADGTLLPAGVTGEFACTSCHVVHGPEPGATTRKLRRDDWKTTCTTCHGTDALIRYSYFHRSDRGLN